MLLWNDEAAQFFPVAARATGIVGWLLGRFLTPNLPHPGGGIKCQKPEWFAVAAECAASWPAPALALLTRSRAWRRAPGDLPWQSSHSRPDFLSWSRAVARGKARKGNAKNAKGRK